MKVFEPRPFVDPDAAALVELANAFEPVQDDAGAGKLQVYGPQ
jgi:hypothetical protein